MTNWHHGRTTGQFIRSLAVAKGNPRGASAYAESQRWSERSDITSTIAFLNSERKSAVSAIGSTSGLMGSPVGTDFMATYRPLSIVGRLDRVARKPVRTRILVWSTGTTAAVVPEGAAIPMSKGGFTYAFLQPVKIAAATAESDELLQNAEPGADEAIATDLASAIALKEDDAVFNPSVTGSVLNGAPSVVSSGSSVAQVDNDLKAVVSALMTAGSNLVAPVWLLGTQTAINLSLLRTSGGALAYPGLNLQDGATLAGVPVLVSKAVSGYIALVDQANLIIGEDEDVEISISTQGVIEMLDNPTGNSLTPVAANVVSMMQTNTIGIKGVLYRAWFGRPGVGAVLSGVTY